MSASNVSVNNSQRNVKNVSNVVQRPKTQSLPLAVPVGINRPPPPPQVFVPVAVNPAPITYRLNPPDVPNDVQAIMNQPAAVMLGEGPEVAAYVPPVYSSPQPTPAPIQSPLPLVPIYQTAQPVPFWKKPEYVVPVVAIAVVAAAYWFSTRNRPRNLTNYYRRNA